MCSKKERIETMDKVKREGWGKGCGRKEQKY